MLDHCQRLKSFISWLLDLVIHEFVLGTSHRYNQLFEEFLLWFKYSFISVNFILTSDLCALSIINCMVFI